MRYPATKQYRSEYRTMVPPGLLNFFYSNKESTFTNGSLPARSVESGSTVKRLQYLKETCLLEVSATNFVNVLASAVLDPEFVPAFETRPRFA